MCVVCLGAAALAASVAARGLATADTLSARSGVIVFTRYLGGNEDLYSLRPGGSRIRRLTTAPESDAAPAVSPNGKLITFESRRNVMTAGGDIWVMSITGASERRLTSEPTSEHSLPGRPAATSSSS